LPSNVEGIVALELFSVDYKVEVLEQQVQLKIDASALSEKEFSLDILRTRFCPNFASFHLSSEVLTIG